MSLPASIAHLLAHATCAGLSGTRTPTPESLAALHLLVQAIPTSAAVIVGCATGIDHAAMAALVHASAAAQLAIFAAFGPSDTGAWAGSAVAAVAAAQRAGAAVTWWAGGGPAVPLVGRLAARSAAAVLACAAMDGLWCAFPAQACPAGLRPAARPGACFSGRGSGTWASLALALGRGLPTIVYLSAGLSAPVGWGLDHVGHGWWIATPARQLAMF